MPIVITPTNKGRDEMGGGGMDIAKTPMKKTKVVMKKEAVGQYADPIYDLLDELDIKDNIVLDELIRYMSGDQVEDFVADFRRNHDMTAPMDEDEVMQNDDIQDIKRLAGLDEGKVKALLMDMEEDAVDMSKEEFIAKYGEYNVDVWNDVQKQKAEMGEDAVNEGGMKQAQIEVQDWFEKFNEYKGTNGDDLAQGWIRATLDTGIMADAYDENEVEAFNKMKGYPTDEIDTSWQKDDFADFTSNKSGASPITAAMFSTINAIMDKYGIDEEDVDDMSKADDPSYSKPGMREEETVDEDTVNIPVRELQDLMRLAGLKIEEYANEPEEEYMDSEEQLIGLSGGLNRPKVMHPTVAGGDNPMAVKPIKVDETEAMSKKYSDFLKEEESQLAERSKGARGGFAGAGNSIDGRNIAKPKIPSPQLSQMSGGPKPRPKAKPTPKPKQGAFMGGGTTKSAFEKEDIIGDIIDKGYTDKTLPNKYRAKPQPKMSPKPRPDMPPVQKAKDSNSGQS
jgi:hypothetical protein